MFHFEQWIQSCQISTTYQEFLRKYKLHYKKSFEVKEQQEGLAYNPKKVLAGVHE